MMSTATSVSAQKNEVNTEDADVMVMEKDNNNNNNNNNNNAHSREKYEAYIANHANYAFIPPDQKRNWVSVSTKTGENPRKPYWDTRRKQLIESGHVPDKSNLATVARFIHPTKKHVCGKCEMACSIYYVYPTAYTCKWLKTTFDYDKNDDTVQHKTIFEIYDMLRLLLLTTAASNRNVEGAFEKYFDMSMTELEIRCNSDKYSGSKLSPGVMSNAPDRLDGFHCYNSICGCRARADKGRSTENMKSYIRDRRAYELLSDGNCLAANCLMGVLNTITATCFICGKSDLMTADHIGPISLGFIHDPENFQACCKRCNSCKNNRITEEDVAKLKFKEENGARLVSWWAEDAWNKNKCESGPTLKDNLNKNTKMFLSIVLWLKMNKLDVLESFITETYMDHEKSYKIRRDHVEINSSGDIKFEYTDTLTGKKTKDTQKKRTKQILLELNDKSNRKINIELSEKETTYLSDITLADFKNKICKVLVGL